MHHRTSNSLASDDTLVIVLGADSPIGLTIIRELGQRGVSVLAQGRSRHALGRYSRYVKRSVTTDRPIAEWLPKLVTECHATAVLAYSEHHLLQLAALKSGIDCKVLCPDNEQLATVLDKNLTLAVASRLGINVPRTWLPLRGDMFAEKAASLSYPVAVKWPDPNQVADRLAAIGLNLEKVEYANSPHELLKLLSRYHSLGTWPMVQSWCPGYGLGQMLHLHEGVATLKFQHRRLREWPPSGGVSSFCEAVSLEMHREQMTLSERLLQEIGWQGPAMVEYRYDPASETYWLMEVNGRFWGSIPLAHHSGAHFAWETYRCGVGEASAAQDRHRMLRARYVIPDMKHMAAVLRDKTRPLAGRLRLLSGFLADFVDPRVRYYVWSARDPLPFFSDIWGVLRRAARMGT